MKSKKSKGSKSSVAEVIAKSCGLKSLDFDPTLSDLFTSNKYQIKKEKLSPLSHGGESYSIENTTSPDAKLNIQENEVKLSHKDAASIRVKAKQKSRLSDVIDKKQKSEKTEKTKVQGSKVKKKKGKGIKNKQAEESDEEIAAVLPTDELVDEDIKLDDSHEAPDSDETKSGLKNDSQEKEADAKEKVPSIAELNAPKNKNPEAEARTVFIGNVPKNLTIKKLKKLFKDHGEIETVRFRGAAPSKPTQLKKVAIFRNEIHPDRNSLVAFIRYKTREEAEQAVRIMNGAIIEEHHITVDHADNKTKDGEKAVFIGNLYLKMNDDDLWNCFEDCGKVHSVRIVRDPITGLGKGIGYVNFEDSAGVELALKKNGTELKGRPMRISRVMMTNKKKQKSNLSETGQKNKNPKKVYKPNERSNTWKQRTEENPNSNKMNYSGDRIAEIGKLKRKSSKPNRGEAKRARFAKQLTGNSVTKRTKIKKIRTK